MVRAIALVQYLEAGLNPEEDEDLKKDAVDALNDASWPDVDGDDWCGEWERRR